MLVWSLSASPSPPPVDDNEEDDADADNDEDVADVEATAAGRDSSNGSPKPCMSSAINRFLCMTECGSGQPIS